MSDWYVAVVGGIIATVVGGLIVFYLTTGKSPPQTAPIAVSPPPTNIPPKFEENTPLNPRKELVGLGVPIDFKGWSEAIRNCDLHIITLFVNAGFNPFGGRISVEEFAGFDATNYQECFKKPAVREALRPLREKAQTTMCPWNCGKQLDYLRPVIMNMGLDLYKYYCPNFLRDVADARQRMEAQRERVPTDYANCVFNVQHFQRFIEAQGD